MSSQQIYLLQVMKYGTHIWMSINAKYFRNHPFIWYEKCFRIFKGSLANRKYAVSTTTEMTGMNSTSSSAVSFGKPEFISLIDESGDDFELDVRKLSNKRKNTSMNGNQEMISILHDLKDTFKASC